MRLSVGYALSVLVGAPAVLGAQGFGIYELGSCGMARAGTGVAAPCALQEIPRGEGDPSGSG